MNKLIALLCQSTTVAMALDQNELLQLNAKRSIYRSDDPHFSAFSKKITAMSSLELSETLKKLSINGTRNFLHILNQSRDKDFLLQWYLDVISNTENDKAQFILYFSSRIISKNDIPKIIKKAKENSNNKQLLELICTTPSKEAFEYLYELKSNNKKWLLATVTPANFQTVLKLLEANNEHALDIAKRMLRLPVTKEFTLNELIYKIENLYVSKKPQFSEDKVASLINLITSFNRA